MLEHFDIRLRRRKLTPAIVAAALSACATETVLLNSERIERKFGSYGIDVLASEAGLRRSSLYSMEGGQSVCRTYALVRFADDRHASLESGHAEVLAGNSLGEVFKADGWNIHKQTLYIGSMQLANASSELASLMQLDETTPIALHVYQLLLERGDQIYAYATIAEAHHPQYLTEMDLLSIYRYDETGVDGPDTITELEELLLRPPQR